MTRGPNRADHQLNKRENVMQEATGAHSVDRQLQILRLSLAKRKRASPVILIGIVVLLQSICLAQAADQSSATKEIGDEVQWTEYQDIETDDCVSIPFVGTTCQHVTYKFQFRGKVVSIDSQNQEYGVSLTSRRVVPQDTVSPMYWTYKDRAQEWADQQTYRTVGFSNVE
jgi:hypothetical protein